MTSKVKIKAGAIEIEFEGSEEYMKDELPGLETSLRERLNSRDPDVRRRAGWVLDAIAT